MHASSYNKVLVTQLFTKELNNLEENVMIAEKSLF